MLFTKTLIWDIITYLSEEVGYGNIFEMVIGYCGGYYIVFVLEIMEGEYGKYKITL